MEFVWDRLAKSKKPILLYGTGNGADKILNELERLGINISGVFASDGFVRNRIFRGFPVMSLSEAESKFNDFLVLTAFGSSRADVINNIKYIGASHELYSVDVPVYGDSVFNRDFYNDNSEKISIVRNMLEEDSKAIFDSIVEFKSTGNINCLFECQTSPDEAFRNILKLSDNETFMDLGAFNGDTVFEFLKYTKGYREIYAVEPDVKNFEKLKKNTESLYNIHYINECVSNNEGTVVFSKHGGRNGSSDKNGVPVKCNTIDGILDGKEATYIKFDVEGLECRAIEGAYKTITEFKPKMLISCYHRTEDIFEIPLKVFKIRNDYKVYIRHYPYIPAWDTQFYFI